MKNTIKHFISGSALLFAAMIASQSAMAGGHGKIMVDDPYVRAVPPGQTNSAAFMTLHNHAANNKTLIAASSPAAKVVELHQHINEGGMMKMRRIEGGIEIKSHDMTVLQPGGLHVMLIGLTQKLTPGELIPITLQFSDNSKKEIKAEVRKIQMEMKKMDKHMQHNH